MLTHEEMVGLQAEKHELIDAFNFKTKEEYVLHLIHSFPYTLIANFAKDKVVLDLGCNTGYGSEILSRKARKTIGVDVSENAILISQKQYGQHNIDFQLIDGKKLPFNNNQFDVIVSCQVIEHIIDYGVYISEIKRVLSSSGLVFFTTPNAFLRLDPGMKPWNQFHVREFNHLELSNLLDNYFALVNTLGLNTINSLTEIELHRINKSKEFARVSQKSSSITNQFSFKSIVKTLLPKVILTKLRTLKKHSNERNQKVDAKFIEKHGFKDFSYSDTKLAKAIDLLGVCSDDDKTINEFQNYLKKLKNL